MKRTTGTHCHIRVIVNAKKRNEKKENPWRYSRIIMQKKSLQISWKMLGQDTWATSRPCVRNMSLTSKHLHTSYALTSREMPESFIIASESRKGFFRNSCVSYRIETHPRTIKTKYQTVWCTFWYMNIYRRNGTINLPWTHCLHGWTN